MRRTAAGKIQSFDQGDRTIVLEGGQSFAIAPAVDMTAFRTGDYVRVEFDEVGEQRNPEDPRRPNDKRNPDDQRGPTDGQRYTQIADVVAKSSPDHPDHRRDGPNPDRGPNVLTRSPPGTPAPTPAPGQARPGAVNTTESLRGGTQADRDAAARGGTQADKDAAARAEAARRKP